MATARKKANRQSRNGQRRGRVFIERERCKGCGYCVEFCPTNVLELEEGFNSKGYHPPRAVRPEACTGCDLCGLYCPDFAIHGERQPDSHKRTQTNSKNGNRENDDAAA